MKIITPESRKLKRKQMLVIMLVVSVIAVTNVPLLAAAEVSTETLFETISEMVGEIYTGILGISTVVAALGCAIAFIIRMISRNTRSIEEANSWLKRIAISWLVLNALAFFVAYGRTIVDKLNENAEAIY